MTLRLRQIRKTFQVANAQQRELVAVDNVDLDVQEGEVHGLVGESGSGKSTLARIAIRLLQADTGSIYWHDTEVSHLPEKQLRPLRPRIQMIFQDPFSSLNPRQTVGSALAEPLKVHQQANGPELENQIVSMLERVGLAPDDRKLFPHQFSGGQRQRICIARALMLQPSIIIADEAVSALDVSIQAQILALMMQLKEEMGLSYLFITHDLEVVRLIADRISVMQNGRLVECGTTTEIFESPQEEYTRRLLHSRPSNIAAIREDI